MPIQIKHPLVSHFDPIKVEEWYKQTGEAVAQGEPVVRLSCEEYQQDIIAPATGILLEKFSFVNNRSNPPTIIGTIRAVDELIDINPFYDLTVLEYFCQPGDEIKPGDLLFKGDSYGTKLSMYSSYYGKIVEMPVPINTLSKRHVALIRLADAIGINSEQEREMVYKKQRMADMGLK